MAMSGDKVVATKRPQVTAYVSESVNSALDQEAAKERRSRSQMVELLLEEALKARGHQFADQEPAEDQ